MDYIDLLQIHRFDPDTSIVETMRALHDIVQTGKVRCEWGGAGRGVSLDGRLNCPLDEQTLARRPCTPINLSKCR